MQLGKTPMSPVDLNDLASHNKRLTPTNYKIFLYSIEQLEDQHKQRSEAFRSDLQHFLRLKQPFKPFQKENVNTVKRNETIDICKNEYAELRNVLVKQGQKTMNFIKAFIDSDDVFVSDKDYFLSLIATWGNDPCQIEGFLH